MTHLLCAVVGAPLAPLAAAPGAQQSGSRISAPETASDKITKLARGRGRTADWSAKTRGQGLGHMRRLGRWTGALALVLVLTGCTPGLTDPASSVADVAPSGTGLPSPGADGAPTPTAEPTTAPAEPPVTEAPPLVPEQAPTKTFAVGSRELNLSRGNRPLRTVVWYPAAGTAGGPLATAAAGPFPLVLFSHGL